MSYNNIGLASVRGSGTNGYVQKNLSTVRRHKDHTKYASEYGNDTARAERNERLFNRKPNAELLEHERKREIELKCVEMQDLMEEQGYPDDEIEEKVDELRKQLLADYEKAKAAGGRAAAGAHGGGSHSVAEAKAEKMKAFGGALGIQESYVAGAAFKPEYREQKQRERQEEKERRQQEREEREAKHAAERARREREREEREAERTKLLARPSDHSGGRKRDERDGGGRSRGDDRDDDGRDGSTKRRRDDASPAAARPRSLEPHSPPSTRREPTRDDREGRAKSKDSPRRGDGRAGSPRSRGGRDSERRRRRSKSSSSSGSGSGSGSGSSSSGSSSDSDSDPN